MKSSLFLLLVGLVVSRMVGSCTGGGTLSFKICLSPLLPTETLLTSLSSTALLKMYLSKLFIFFCRSQNKGTTYGLSSVEVLSINSTIFTLQEELPEESLYCLR